MLEHDCTNLVPEFRNIMRHVVHPVCKNKVQDLKYGDIFVTSRTENVGYLRLIGSHDSMAVTSSTVTICYKFVILQEHSQWYK
jgi:hypothetical protein